MSPPRRKPQIFAIGGGGFSMEPRNPRLDDYLLRISGTKRPRVCFVPTASGDADRYVAKFLRAFPPRRARASVLRLFRREIADLDAFVRAQDVVYVGGGNAVNMLVVWRAHGLDRALRRAWRAGVVMAGISAGALCWFEGCATDSYGGFGTFADGLGFLPGSATVHYDCEARRRPAYQAAVKDGLPAGWAFEDGTAAHFVGRRLHAVVASRTGPVVYRVERKRDRVTETVFPPRLLTRGGAIA